MKILVVPSNRPDQLRQFFEAWRGKGGWDAAIVVWDYPTVSHEVVESIVRNDKPVTIYSHAEIKHHLGDDAWVISKKDSACRCFGLLAAWHLGADYVLTLDDDVRPERGYDDLFHQHWDRMENEQVWSSTLRFINTRGLPYLNRGRRTDVAMSMGLWTGNFDLDAKTQIEAPFLPSMPPFGNRLLALGEYAPISGMNLAAKRCAIPLMYFPLMGEGQPYSRYDDIWMGVIAKKLCDHLEWSISVGEPFVRHEKASDPHVNLVKEAPGMEANEWFWEVIDNVQIKEYYHAPLEVMHDLGEQLTFGKLRWSGERSIEQGLLYVKQLGKALRVWASLFNKKLEF